MARILPASTQRETIASLRRKENGVGTLAFANLSLTAVTFSVFSLSGDEPGGFLVMAMSGVDFSARCSAASPSRPELVARRPTRPKELTDEPAVQATVGSRQQRRAGRNRVLPTGGVPASPPPAPARSVDEPRRSASIGSSSVLYRRGVSGVGRATARFVRTSQIPGRKDGPAVLREDGFPADDQEVSHIDNTRRLFPERPVQVA